MKLNLFSKENGLTTGLCVIALSIINITMMDGSITGNAIVIIVGVGLICRRFWKSRSQRF